MEDQRKNAAFLDMDDTIIETKSGQWPPQDITDWKIKDGMLDKLRWLQENFDFLIVVSNQGGIEAGYTTYEGVRAKMTAIKLVLETNGIKLDEMLFSPYNSYHYTRKPNPGFAYQMAIKYQLDLSRCIMFGDASGITDTIMVGELEGKEGVRFAGNLRHRKDYMNVSGELVPEEMKDKIIVDNGIRKIVIRKDFSDSDKMFAKNAGMRYMDIEKFLQTNLSHEDLMFKSK